MLTRAFDDDEGSCLDEFVCKSSQLKDSGMMSKGNVPGSPT
jgi:hypothetical protein